MLDNLKKTSIKVERTMLDNLKKTSIKVERAMLANLKKTIRNSFCGYATHSPQKIKYILMNAFNIRLSRLYEALKAVSLVMVMFLGVFACCGNNPGITISETMHNLNEGNTATYTVALNTQPMDDVVFIVESANITSVRVDADMEIELDQNILTFTNSNWDTAQTITLTALTDVNLNNESIRVAHIIDVRDTLDMTYAALTDLDSAMVTVTDGKGVIGMTKVDDAAISGLTLNSRDFFGSSTAWLSNLGSTGNTGGVLAVGVSGADGGGGGTDRGAVHVLWLNANGTVNRSIEINRTTMNGPTTLEDEDGFGASVAWLGDLDGAGGTARVLAVGAEGDNEGGDNRGAVHLVWLTTEGTVASTTEINNSSSTSLALEDGDTFGSSTAWLGDLDGTGGTAGVLAVGAERDDGRGANRGAVHLIWLDADGTVDRTTEINDAIPRGPALSNGDSFGSSIAWVGDLNEEEGILGVLAVGAKNADGRRGGASRGTVHLIWLNTDGTVNRSTEINDALPRGPILNNSDLFGSSTAWLGDLDGAGNTAGVLAVGALGDDGEGVDRGATHLVWLNPDGTVRQTTEVNDTVTEPTLINGDSFGDSVAWLGNLNRDDEGGASGVLAIGATGDSNGTVHLISIR